ncbi:hypothetical protein [Aquimarina aquimarini]|uniref:hypothetical protein n=1 Tax=Aquimarina aquimarini TaxID=1191734 RepID=UPI000D5593C7|nr:hypothetical protein [Aquimarina aquimarini]
MSVEDWLSREVKKITQFLVNLLSKATEITTSNKEESVTIITNKLEEELELSLEEVCNMDKMLLITTLKKRNFDLQHIELLGDVLAELCFKKTTLQNTCQKANELYEYVQSNTTTYSIELNQKIERLNNQ